MPPHHVPIPVAFLDTNVLWPVNLADLLLSTAEAGFFDLCTSDDLVEETERVLVEYKGLPQEKAATFASQVRELAEQHVPRSRYMSLAGRLTGPDPVDLLHLAAAIEAGADYVVTNNTRDFINAVVPAETASPTIVTPDELIMIFIDDGLDIDLVSTVQRMADRRRRPPMTIDEVIALIERDGLTRTSDALRRVVGDAAPGARPEIARLINDEDDG
jgi:predicted nucleic acid-binding protein